MVQHFTLLYLDVLFTNSKSWLLDVHFEVALDCAQVVFIRKSFEILIFSSFRSAFL